MQTKTFKVTEGSLTATFHDEELYTRFMDGALTKEDMLGLLPDAVAVYARRQMIRNRGRKIIEEEIAEMLAEKHMTDDSPLYKLIERKYTLESTTSRISVVAQHPRHRIGDFTFG